MIECYIKCYVFDTSKNEVIGLSKFDQLEIDAINNQADFGLRLDPVVIK